TRRRTPKRTRRRAAWGASARASGGVRASPAPVGGGVAALWATAMPCGFVLMTGRASKGETATGWGVVTQSPCRWVAQQRSPDLRRCATDGRLSEPPGRPDRPDLYEGDYE